MKQFNLDAAKQGAKIVTRDGQECTFISYLPDLGINDNLNPLVVHIRDRSIYAFHANGMLNGDGSQSSFDLFMDPTKKKKTWYVNLYTNYEFSINSTKEGAEIISKERRDVFAIAIPVEIEE